MKNIYLPKLSAYHRSLMHPFMLESYDLAQAVSIPRKAYQAFHNQWEGASSRGIKWLFTLTEWWTWWQTYDETHGCVRWERRGRKGTNILMMCRFDDIGPYSPANVYCGTSQDNMRDRVKHFDQSAAAKAWYAANPHQRPLLGRRGDRHPKSHPVMTEMGRFGSIALASEAAGITRAGGLNRVRTGRWQLVIL